uniref:N-acetyltransferase domain-containing protein n=1 Tax=Mycena chlorophos TaxID=658473 RepID=A0ABQ0LQW4_MYCCL|nr:predicted protein [Mycena chlorophos]
MVFVRRLIAPTPEQLDQCAQLMLQSFRVASAQHQDNFGVSLTGGDPSLDLPLHQARLGACVIDGELWVAGFSPEVTDTEICAVAVWYPPGTSGLRTAEQREAGWSQVESKFSPELKKWHAEYFGPRVGAATTEAYGKDVQLNSWHLQLLATSPNHQRKGLAAALIEVIEVKAKAEDKPMCVATTNDPNVVFYKNRGFAFRGSSTIVGTGGETTFTFFSKP